MSKLCVYIPANYFQTVLADDDARVLYKKGQLSLTNLRDTFEKFARFT